MKGLYRKNTTRGFTLIELLVVIAIVGILAGVIMSNLGSANNKGSVAGVRTLLAQLRTQANLYINDFGNFGTAVAVNCSTANTVFADTRFNTILGRIQTTSGFAPTCANTITGLGTWAVSVQTRPEAGNSFLCTDSTGRLKGYPTAPSIAGGVCP